MNTFPLALVPLLLGDVVSSPAMTIAAIGVVLALAAAVTVVVIARAVGGKRRSARPAMAKQVAATPPKAAAPEATTGATTSSPTAPAGAVLSDMPPAPQIPAATTQAASTAGAAQDAQSATVASPPRVFISHSSRDNELGLRLASDLRRALGGVESAVWFDASGGLQGGDIWIDQITAELTSREVFLVILSPAALQSAWVRDELRMAWTQRNLATGGAGKVILPVLAAPCAVPEYLATIQFISFLPPRPYDEALAELLAAVRAGATREVPLGRQASAPLGPPDDVALLPAPDHFVGREVDVAWVLGRLDKPDGDGGGTAAITALRGLGGIGKTTLAAVAVRRLRDEGRFPEGIAVILCQGLSDPAEVLRRVLIRFDPYRRAPEANDLAGLVEAARLGLRGKQALVVFDNVEPELPVAEVVAPLRAAGVALLLTARQALPASVVPVEASRALDLLSPEEALEVFVAALGRGSPDALGSDEYAAAERIVRALDRHTLAVKLAGAYAASERRDLGALAHELAADPDRGLALPGDDETPAAVRRSFALSLDSLPLDARRLFAAFAAFATPECGRGAVLALGKALGQAQPETSLHLLVVRALAEPSVSEVLPAGSDRERLRLHPLLRAFAEDLFARWPEAERDAASLAAARYFADYAEAHQSEDVVLAADEGNLTGALEWAHEHGQGISVVALCDGMWHFWEDRSRLQQELRYLPWGLAALGTQESDAFLRANQQRAARLMRAYGEVLDHVGERERATDTLLQALALFREVKDRRGEGETLRSLGETTGWQGQMDDADAYLRQALTIAREVEDLAAEGRVLSLLGDAARFRGMEAESDGYQKQALTIAREVSDRHAEGVALLGLGINGVWWGRLDDADNYLKQAATIAREVGDRRAEGIAHSQLGQAAQRRGRLGEAERYLQQALLIDREVGDRQSEAAGLFTLGEIARQQGRLEDAERYYRATLNLARESQYRIGEDAALFALGQVALSAHHLEQADVYLNDSLDVARHVGHRQGEGLALAYLGQVAQHRGQFDEAESRYCQALVILRETQDKRALARTLIFYAELQTLRTEYGQAEASLRESVELALAASAGSVLASAQLALGRLLAERLDRREAGCALLQEAVRRFEEMGMPEAAEARAAVERLGCEP